MGRGGKRPGAGRPKGDSADLFKRVSVSLSPEVLGAVDRYASEYGLSRSAAVERLLTLGLMG